MSSVSSIDTRATQETQATSFILSPLQTKGHAEESFELEPLDEDDPRSFDLVAPPTGDWDNYSLETRSEQLFSREHLQIMFSDPPLLLKFTAFLSDKRPGSVPKLISYLDATKAIKAIAYANAIAEALEPMSGHDFAGKTPNPTRNPSLDGYAAMAFDALVQEDLPAFITHLYVSVVSVSISKRIIGSLPPHLREASEGLAEVFCLTDPSRKDNPIVFASEGKLQHTHNILTGSE